MNEPLDPKPPVVDGSAETPAKPPRIGKGKTKGKRRGRPGGEESRARILDFAGHLFAERGFNGVSTRELARAANANVSAIAYYFHGKRGLYHAVLRQLVADTDPIFHPVIEHLDREVEAADGDRKKLAVIAAWLVAGLLRAMLSNERMRWQMGLMLREFHQPSKEFQMLLDDRIHPMHDAVARLVAAVTGGKPKSPETLLLTISVIGQCMTFGAVRNLVFARLDWDDYTSHKVEAVVTSVVRSVLAMLELPHVSAPSAPPPEPLAQGTTGGGLA